MTKEKEEDGRFYVVRYGFHLDFARRSQLPYLSVTGEEWQGTPQRNSMRNLIAGGCLPEMITREFPELAPLLPYHLATIKGPMHYMDTVFFASDRDHNGLLAGERRQIRNKTGVPCWELRVDDGTEHGADAPSRFPQESEERPAGTVTMRWFPWCRVGYGKERELDAARRAACWPDATDAELSTDADTLRAALVARLPSVIAAMRAACEAAGVAWPAAQAVAP